MPIEYHEDETGRKWPLVTRDIETLDPAQFIDALIMLTRSNRKLEFVLADMGRKGHVTLTTLDVDSWECRWVMGTAYHNYRGQATDPRGAALACLEKAKEGLSNG